ncbi:uncharacterized protein V6R79_010992 [Siganus canaliculatus]
MCCSRASLPFQHHVAFVVPALMQHFIMLPLFSNWREMRLMLRPTACIHKMIWQREKNDSIFFRQNTHALQTCHSTQPGAHCQRDPRPQPSSSRSGTRADKLVLLPLVTCEQLGSSSVVTAAATSGSFCRTAESGLRFICDFLNAAPPARQPVWILDLLFDCDLIGSEAQEPLLDLLSCRAESSPPHPHPPPPPPPPTKPSPPPPPCALIGFPSLIRASVKRMNNRS